MGEHNLSWDQVVQMCRQVHPKEEEKLAADAFQAEQLDQEAADAEAAGRALERQRRAAAMEEISEARAELRAELTEARAELAEARAKMATASAALAAALPFPTAPPTDDVIHDIADDNEDEPIRFMFSGD
ncbi:hypothetical protein QYE76_051013 [Lolium multiflorum]|uniref:Uncharacterized protein n=1 Tax=Lolium multiflorum TaxID=4521 RepID=A0AAD8SRW4_LOLMU|nr:hypothetical protein QYE76_051013 [Lolium multiflorum]